jgi:hypothetical protein
MISRNDSDIDKFSFKQAIVIWKEWKKRYFL